MGQRPISHLGGVIPKLAGKGSLETAFPRFWPMWRATTLRAVMGNLNQIVFLFSKVAVKTFFWIYQNVFIMKIVLQIFKESVLPRLDSRSMFSTKNTVLKRWKIVVHTVTKSGLISEFFYFGLWLKSQIKVPNYLDTFSLDG